MNILYNILQHIQSNISIYTTSQIRKQLTDVNKQSKRKEHITSQHYKHTHTHNIASG